MSHTGDLRLGRSKYLLGMRALQALASHQLVHIRLRPEHQAVFVQEENVAEDLRAEEIPQLCLLRPHITILKIDGGKGGHLGQTIYSPLQLMIQVQGRCPA